MKLITKKYADMGGGENNIGYATFKEGSTVKDVLEEIRKFSQEQHRAKPRQIASGFGVNGGTENWAIYIDDELYCSSWGESWRKTYYGGKEDRIVEKIEVDGGWYSWYNFNIVTKRGE